MTSQPTSAADAAAEQFVPAGLLTGPEAPAPEDPPKLCERHGEAMSSMSVIGGGQRDYCPTCTQEAIDAQRELDHARQARDAKIATQKEKQRQLEARIGAAGIPERFRELTFDTFPAHALERPAIASAVSTARSYANRFPRMLEQGISILLIGPTGTGKTGLACSILNAIVRDGHTALFMTAYAAVRHQRDTWGRRGRTERDALDDLISPDLLVLDEIGTSVGTDTEMCMLFEVLNGRYAARKPTILLSNLPIEDYAGASGTRPGLRTFLGERVLERFSDDGSFTMTLSGASLRGRREAPTPPVQWRDDRGGAR